MYADTKTKNTHASYRSGITWMNKWKALSGARTWEATWNADLCGLALEAPLQWWEAGRWDMLRLPVACRLVDFFEKALLSRAWRHRPCPLWECRAAIHIISFPQSKHRKKSQSKLKVLTHLNYSKLNSIESAMLRMLRRILYIRVVRRFDRYCVAAYHRALRRMVSSVFCRKACAFHFSRTNTWLDMNTCYKMLHIIQDQWIFKFCTSPCGSTDDTDATA
jgi:hypothetical protein